MCEMGKANPQVSYHNVMADGTARRPPSENHCFHISQLLVLGMVPVPSPSGQNGLMEGSLKFQTKDTKYQGLE
jgi:hypothetical protein